MKKTNLLAVICTLSLSSAYAAESAKIDLSANSSSSRSSRGTFSEFQVNTDIARDMVQFYNFEAKTNIGKSMLIGGRYMNINTEIDDIDANTITATGQHIGPLFEYHHNDSNFSDGWMIKTGIEYATLTYRDDDYSQLFTEEYKLNGTFSGMYSYALVGYQWHWERIGSTLLFGPETYQVEGEITAKNDNDEIEVDTPVVANNFTFSYSFSYRF